MKINNSVKIVKTFSQNVHNPFQLWSVFMIWMKAFDNDALNQRKNNLFSAHIIFLKIMEPVVTVIFLSVHLFSKLVGVKIERILANKELIHDNAQRKYIVFVVIALRAEVVLRCTVRHRKTWLMVCISKHILFNSG